MECEDQVEMAVICFQKDYGAYLQSGCLYRRVIEVNTSHQRVGKREKISDLAFICKCIFNY